MATGKDRFAELLNKQDYPMITSFKQTFIDALKQYYFVGGIQKMTLYDLGYPLGAHIEVIQRNGALDFLDTEKITRTVFALDKDHLKMHEIHKF